jgi:parvulin-like peptidyl-prolyl cis-trans isomerase-like protein
MTSGGRTRRAGSLFLLASLAAAPIAALTSGGSGGEVLAARAPMASAPSAGSGASVKAKPSLPAVQRPRRHPGSVTLPAGHPLPDTVLAVVNGSRTVTVDAFRRGWVQVAGPSRPDSLTPEAARRFLDLLIDKELLAAQAIDEKWEWTSIESIQVANLRDRTMMRVALDSTLATFARARAARGDSALGAEALGVVARESTVARLEVRYDELLMERLARAWAALPRPSADSSIWSRLRTMGQMPVIEPADSARVVAWSGIGTSRVLDLLEAWKKLNPLFRPRVESLEQVRDLVKNGLFERVLRGHAERDHLERHPAVLQAVARQEEFLASQYYVTREVYGAIPTDEATLRRYYQRDPKAWTIPARLSVVRMILPERGEAARMAVRLRDQAEADTLVARGLRQRVNYVTEIAAASDSALFAAAMRSGTGTVLGPDSVRTGWQVVRVNALLPAQGRTFDEVKDLALRAWSDEEGERRMKALLATLRRRAKVVVNETALARTVSAGMPAARQR